MENTFTIQDLVDYILEYTNMGSLEELKTYFADESYSHHTAQAVIEFIEDKLTISNMEKKLNEYGEELELYTCNKCGKEFWADGGIGKGSALCTPCWKDYVGVMHSDFVSVEDKVRISTELSKLKTKEDEK